MSQAPLERTLTGTVVSQKMDKTIVVSITTKMKHKVGKYISRTKKIHAHDEENTASVGDVVVVKECAPMSKTKSWVLVSVKS